jgi:tetratricopeptide (TPR) repeat protein
MKNELSASGILLACAASLCLLLPLSAAAQTEPTARDAEAHALFEAARIAFTAGHYEDAYDRFSQSYVLSARPELLYNLGAAADRLRRDALALDHYRAYLAAVPDSPQREDVEHRIAILEGAHADDREPVVAVLADDPEPVVADTPSVPPPAAPPTEDAPLVEQWWLWTILGVVVVGIGVGVGVGVATSGPSTAAPMPGDVGPGGVVLTLTSF